MFGTTPAHGFFIRHAKGIELNRIEIQSPQPDARPAFVLDHVAHAEFFRVKAPHTPNPAADRTESREGFQRI